LRVRTSPNADITQSICYFQRDGEISVQRHYLRLLSKAAGDAGREPVLAREAFKELGIKHEAEAHPKGGVRVFFETDLDADAVLGALDKHGLMLVL
jgi:hypothetical protein